jgi:hypothetical protein
VGRLAGIATLSAAGIYTAGVLNPFGQVVEGRSTVEVAALGMVASAMPVARVVTAYGPVTLLVAAVLVALIARRDWRPVWVMLVGTIGTFAITSMLFNLLPRPSFDAVQDIGSSASFPSPLLATLMAFAVCAARVLPHRPVLVRTVLTVAVTALTLLLHLGMWNRASDLVAAVLLGTAGGLVTCTVNRRRGVARQVLPGWDDLRHSTFIRYSAAVCAVTTVIALTVALAGPEPRSVPAMLGAWSAALSTASACGLIAVAATLTPGRAVASTPTPVRAERGTDSDVPTGGAR